MAITQAMCTSFKVALLGAEMDFSGDTTQTFKIALYTSSATLSAATTAYTTANEVTGTSYVAGGNTLTISTNPTGSGTTAYIDFADTTWAKSIYAVAVLDFGADKTSTAGDFTVQFPAADAANAIVRIATP